MTTPRPDRLLLVFPDPLRGRTETAAAFQQLIEVSEGRDIEVLTPISTPQIAELVAEFNSAMLLENDALKLQLTDVQNQLDSAKAKIEQLMFDAPWDRRIIDASAFLARVLPEELFALFSSSDENVKAIAEMLKAYKANDWPILLDSPEMQASVAYLEKIGLVNSERLKSLCADSTQAESYKIGE